MTIAIKRAETLLKKFGFNPGKVDGVVTKNLTTAVKQFQDAWGLPQTGVLDASTQAKMLRTAERLPTRNHMTGVGQAGAKVLDTEKKLKALGYNVGKVDGIFSRDTAAAVLAFRKDQKEIISTTSAIGAIGDKGRAVLDAEWKKLQHGVERQRRAPSVQQTKLDNATAKAVSTAPLAVGSSGVAVVNIQQHLRAAGFDPKHVGGKFDERTGAALKAFQRHAGLPATGTVDAATWKSLKNSFILTKSAANPAQSVGERSRAVKTTEQLLKKMGFNPGKIDGLFDKRTLNAVKKYERKEGINVDGRVDPKQLSRMVKDSKEVTSSPPPSDYRHTTWTGKTISVRTKVMLDRAEQYLRKMGVGHEIQLAQGSYHKGVGASGHTHDAGGSVDVRVVTPSGKLLSRDMQLKLVKALRMAGFAAWSRGPRSIDGMDPHIHATAIGDRQAHPTAKQQVQEYFAHGDGLRGSRADRDRSVGYPVPAWAKKFD